MCWAPPVAVLPGGARVREGLREAGLASFTSWAQPGERPTLRTGIPTTASRASAKLLIGPGAQPATSL